MGKNTVNKEKVITPKEGDGFMICVGRANDASSPEEIVTVDGRQYAVFGVHGVLGEDMHPEPGWVFDFNQEDAMNARIKSLRTSDNQELKERLKAMDTY